jgi:hypothetical protein
LVRISKCVVYLAVRRWKIIRKYYPSLGRAISKTRLVVGINGIKQIVEFLSLIWVTVEEMGLVTLQPHSSNDLYPIKEHLDTFKCVLLSTRSNENLNLLQQ